MRKRCVVEGLVQGVNFRVAAADEARRLGLTGRIWNRDDGAVECIVEGEAGAVEQMQEWLARGPRMARVERVVGTDLGGGGAEYDDFQIGAVRARS